MGEINHFSHVEHSLKLIENWETIVDDHGEKKGEVRCEGCREPILTVGGAAYGCILCRYFWHKTCAELPPTINHKSHPFNPLTLTNSNKSFYCDLCGNARQLIEGFSYKCIRCDFDACVKCGVVFVAQQAAADALKEEASIKFEHDGHPQHTLTLQLRPAAFLCDACNTKDEGLFYQCDSCDFWIHKTCASLAPTIDLPHHPNHPLVLVYLLPERFYNYPYYCEFCDKRIMQNDWLYHCANCRYFAHIKCALKAEQTFVSSTKSIVDLLQFTDPLKLLYSGKVSSDDDEDPVEVNHWSHDHPLILNVESRDGCSFTLHKYCAQLPLTLPHQLHPDHSLDLVDTSGGYWLVHVGRGERRGKWWLSLRLVDPGILKRGKCDGLVRELGPGWFMLV
ncbi:C1-like protein [Artemisia annua]|uniref:C1-like protein n=1 Tax=Artemisia annua TaxID=35608 RepID=A0A2U1NVY3_ARTAN|nr:C1-like protein [Artemisia annua]